MNASDGKGRVERSDDTTLTSSVEFEPEEVHKKYRQERDRRLKPNRAAIKDLTKQTFAAFRKDPFTPFVSRDPVTDVVEVAIIGAGIGGLTTGAELRRAGVEKIRLIDEAGDVGGTWYWNRYPGVMCDVESYIYLPYLEERGYVPSLKYAYGDEIREHLGWIAEKYDLRRDALFQTRTESAEWNEELGNWIIRTNRGDAFETQYLVVAPGILNLMKIPDVAGIERFRGKAFHTARWDYDFTGGDVHGGISELADKVVGIIGAGASAIQCVPHLAESTKHLYVFQRTPSCVGVRGNAPTSEELADRMHSTPGWQDERMYNFHGMVAGGAIETDMVDDGWTHNFSRVWSPRVTPEMTPEEIMRQVELADFEIMEEHRKRIDEIVEDREKAEILKPYYRYVCKRPLFHDEYLPAFNRSNVTLVDCPAGIERITEHGLLCNGQEIALDCLVFATGFEAEWTPLTRKVGHDIVGRGGLRLSEKWKDAPATLHGMTTRGFPNFFIMPSPFQQSVASVNYTFICVLAAEHIGQTVKILRSERVKKFDVSEVAEKEYVEGIVATFVDSTELMEACTPSRINHEGDPRALTPETGAYGGGLGNLAGYVTMLAEFRDSGLAGFELD
jgi:cyclohexanone monooxygenase/pentalenolactone D synthase